MTQEPSKSSRKKFLLWSAAILSSAGLMKFLPKQKQKKIPPASTVKMLTQDGKLVEIDQKLVASASKKISNEELQKWVKK